MSAWADLYSGELGALQASVSAPLGQLLAATAAHLRGDDASAARVLSAAVRQLDALETQLHASVGRPHLGRLQGGDAGNKLVETAVEWLATSVRAPERLAAMLLPGWR